MFVQNILWINNTNYKLYIFRYLSKNQHAFGVNFIVYNILYCHKMIKQYSFWDSIMYDDIIMHSLNVCICACVHFI